MKNGLKVVTPGLHTTVQDLGRIGYQHIGVPVSGALDGYSLRLANALAGNPQSMAALEILGSGPTLEVAADTVRVALVGAGTALEIRGETACIVTAGQSTMLSRGDVVRIAVGRASACCYLAVAGGIAVPLVLDSASTYVRAGIGGFNGRALQRDDVVPLAIERAPERAELRIPAAAGVSELQPVRIVLGPQEEHFEAAALELLVDAEFRVSRDTDRMGMRLEGPLLRHKAGWDIVSDAIATGSIQVPGSGQPIVLLADHQTTGGYPKIATVISPDLSLVARRRPGDILRFAAVDIESAERLCREEEARLAAVIAAFEPVAVTGGLDLKGLYRENLISGVVTGID